MLWEGPTTERQFCTSCCNMKMGRHEWIWCHTLNLKSGFDLHHKVRSTSLVYNLHIILACTAATWVQDILHDLFMLMGDIDGIPLGGFHNQNLC